MVGAGPAIQRRSVIQQKRLDIKETFPDLPSLLAQVRRVPGAFGLSKSVDSLAGFLLGIELAEDFHHIPTEQRYGGFDGESFGEWVAREHNPTRLEVRSLYGSFHLAKQAAGPDAAGFEQWFQWYDEFRRASGQPAAG